MDVRHFQAQSRNPPGHDQMKSAMRTAEQRLIEIARRIGHGSICGLRVRGGRPVMERAIKTRCRHRLGKADLPARRRRAGEDFKLKHLHREFIEKIRRIEDGLVSIDVQDGLPIGLIVEEEISDPLFSPPES